MWTEHHIQREMEFVYSKVIVRSVNTFIPLGYDTINSSLVERGRSLMDPQPHPLLHSRWNRRPRMSSSGRQECGSHKGKLWAVRRMLKYFPAKSLKLIPHQIGSMATSVIMQMDDSIWQHSRVFWLHGMSQHPQPPRNKPHLSAFHCLPSFPMLDIHTLHYTHLQSNKGTSVWTFAFSLCMSPILQVAVSIRKDSVASFCEECVLWQVFGFHLIAPYTSKRSRVRFPAVP